MPALTSLPVIAELRAPTRAAAAKRRRLRKILSALCLCLATWLLLGSLAPPKASPTSSGVQEPTRTGRHTFHLPLDERTAAAFANAPAIDVWDASGTRLARAAPVVPAPDRSGSRASESFRSNAIRPEGGILIALTSQELRSITRHLAKNEIASKQTFFITATN